MEILSISHIIIIFAKIWHTPKKTILLNCDSRDNYSFTHFTEMTTFIEK